MQGNKPYLRPELECSFADIDKRSAECYNTLEKLNISLAYLANLMREITTSQAVPIAVLSEEDSLARHANVVLNVLPKVSK